MRLYYPIEVDLFRPYPLPIMEAQQNNIGRGAQVTLKANGAIIQPTNEELTFWAKKPDGKVSYLAATLSGTNVQLDFTNQMLAVPGMVQVEIRMTSGDGASTTDISTPIFSVRVNPSNISDGAVESSNEFTALLRSLGEIEELKKNGLKGDPGEAASITVGTVGQTPVGTVPTVRNSGTDSAAVLDFTFPEAETGFYDVTLALSAGGWEGTAAPYSQTVSAKGMTAEKAATYAQVTAETIPTEEERAEYAKLQGVLQGAGQVTFYCMEKPVIDLAVRAYNGAGTEESGGGGALDLAVIAADFSETATYAVGSYCIYNQELNRFTEAKEAGGWNAGKVVPTTVAEELTSISQRLNEQIEKDALTRFEAAYPASGSTYYTKILHIDRSQFAAEIQKAYFVNTLNDFCVLKFDFHADGLYVGVGAQGPFINSANVYLAKKTAGNETYTDVYIVSPYTAGGKMSLKEILSDIPDGASDPFAVIANGEKHTEDELKTDYDTVTRPTESRVDRYYKRKLSYTTEVPRASTGDTLSSQYIDDGKSYEIQEEVRIYSNPANADFYITTSGKERCISFSAVLIEKTSGMTYPLPYSNIGLTDAGANELGKVVMQISGPDRTYGRIREIGTTGIALSDCILAVSRQYITVS